MYKLVAVGMIAAVLLIAGAGYSVFTRLKPPAAVSQTATSQASLPFDLDELLEALSPQQREKARPIFEKLCTIAEPRSDGTWDVESRALLVQLLGGTLESKAQALYRQDVIPSQRLELEFREPAGTTSTRSGVTILGYADHRTDEWRALHNVDGDVRVTQENLVDVLRLVYK